MRVECRKSPRECVGNQRRARYHVDDDFLDGRFALDVRRLARFGQASRRIARLLGCDRSYLRWVGKWTGVPPTAVQTNSRLRMNASVLPSRSSQTLHRVKWCPGMVTAQLGRSTEKEGDRSRPPFTANSERLALPDLVPTG